MDELKTNEEFQALAEEVNAILVEGSKVFREVKVKTMWLVGQAISASEQYKKFGKGNYDFILSLAEEIKKQNVGLPFGETTLYYCLQIFEMFPEWEQLVSKSVELFGNNFSWNKVVKGLLHEHINDKGECLHEQTKIICVTCGKKVSQ